MKNSRIMIGRVTFLILAFLFAICITIQFLFAGMAIFMNPQHWMKHMFFVHLFGFNIPVLMLISLVIGKFPRWGYWHIFFIFINIFLMYFSANITRILPWIGALHPLFGVLLIIITFSVIWKTWHITFNHAKKGVKK